MTVQGGRLTADVARMLDEETHRQRKSFKEVVNQAIRRGLSRRSEEPRKRFRVRPHRTTLRPGIDAGAFNRLVDELEDFDSCGRWAPVRI